MDTFNVKNGIWLTMNPVEQTGWVIVDPGPLTQAQISDVIIARTVMPPEKREKFAITPMLSNFPPVNQYTLLKRPPGSMICASTKNNPT